MGNTAKKPSVDIQKRTVEMSSFERSTYHDSNTQMSTSSGQASDIDDDKVSREEIDIMNVKFQYMENHVEKLTEQVFELKSNINLSKWAEEYDLNNDDTKIHVTEDAFTFIMINPLSLAACSGYCIYVIQMASYLLVISRHYANKFNGSDFLTVSGLMIPKGVTEEVHAGQFIGILLIVIINDSLWEPIVDFSSVDIPHLKTQQITIIWWVIPNLLRLSGGLLLTVVMFFLVIESDDVVELFKDFTAVIFISSFDNMLYSLAKFNILGRRLKKATEDCKKVFLQKNRSGNQISKGYILHACSAIFKPSFIMFVLLTTMYVVWTIYIVLPQRNGDYLCQNMYLQFDDEVDSTLSFFSGSYVLQRGNQKRDFYQTYKENKDSIESNMTKHAMVFRYCKNRGFWALSEEDNNDRSKECNSERILVKSAEVSHQAKFNIFEVSSEDWFVKYPKDKRWMPLKDFHLSCQDRGAKYTTNMIDNFCPELVVDERNNAFVSTRSWSTNFTQMVFPSNNKPVMVYSHPVYFSPGSNNEYDLLFFVGKRWIITSSSALIEMIELTRNENVNKNELQELATYLNDKFHGHWSRYRVAFFSEPVLSDTPQDALTPAGLNWFSALDDSKGLIKQADSNRQQESVLRCSLCDDKLNPCFYEGICHSNKTCECTSGSSGTLCQVLPTQNGLCDDTFNNREFDFDGGDCCINTCVSSDDYVCGSDKTGKFYVGYDRCEVETCNDCWRTSTNNRLSSFNGMIVTYVSLSANGRVLGLIESISSTVRVYDIDGSKWIMRGSAVTTSLQPTLDKVDVSEIDYILNRKGTFSPLTVAVRIQSTVQVFDWRDGIWEETKNNMFNNASLHVKDVQLRNNGKSLGILFEDNSFSLFERFSYLVPWKEIQHITENKYESFSFSDNGRTIIMANKTCIGMYARDKNEPLNSTCFTQDIKKVQVSRGGHSVGVFTEDRGINGDIFTFRISGHNLTSLNGVLRGVPFQDASIGITDKGRNIAVHSSSDSVLRFFKWEEKWIKEEQEIKCKSMFAANENSVIAVVPTQVISSGVPWDSVKVYHKQMYCDDGMSKLRLTFVPDNNPTELSWEILDIDSQGDMELLASGGPYSIPNSTITHELCIDDNLKQDSKNSKRCIAFKLLDEGLDGLLSDGMIGISLNGTVEFFIDKTYGYNSTYPVLGNMDCLNNYKNDVSHDSWRFNEKDHIDCFTVDCKWVEFVGLQNKVFPTTKIKLMSMSADGSVIAFGVLDDRSGKHQIQVLRSDRNGVWSQLGSNITVSIDEYSTRFYSLSADGSVLAVCSRPGSYQAGNVLVYMYNEKKGDWLQKGNDIRIKVGMVSTDDVKINSAGDQIVVTGLNEDVDDESQFCAVQSFLYVDSTNEWVKHGNCTFSTDKTAYHVTAISSNGSIVAVSELTFDFPSVVKIYSLDAQSSEWIQQGNDIEEYGPGQFLGITISLSSDGSIVALGGQYNFPIRVYHLDENHEWSQLGNDISLSSPRYYILPLLSTSGLTLSLTTTSTSGQIMTSIFLYDKVYQVWLQSPMSLPLVNPSTLSVSHALVPDIAASADLRTIGFQSGNSLKMYHLTIQSNDYTRSCSGHQISFNFTIKPDQFPEDIEWLLQTKNDIITGGRLPSAVANTEISYRRCISLTNEFFIFLIGDRYGDGLCCEWGDGYFELEWNNTKVLDSSNFKQSKRLCLSNNNSKVSLLTIAFDRYEKSVIWSLLNSDLGKEFDGSGSDVNEEQVFYQCIPSNKCFYLIVEDYTGHGVPYSVTYDDESLYRNENKPFYVNRVKIGNCETRMCSQDQSLMEFYFATNGEFQTFAWELVNGDNSVIDSSTGLYESSSLIFYERCISTSVDECLFLRLRDMVDDKLAAVRQTIYSVEMDGNIIHNNMTSGGFEKVNVLGECNDYYCRDNAFFQLYLHFDYVGKANSSHENSWELLHNDTVLERTNGIPSSWEGLFLKNHTIYYFQRCLSVDTNACLTLHLKDSGGDGGVYYLVNYKGNYIRVGFQTNDLLKIKMGSCV